MKNKLLYLCILFSSIRATAQSRDFDLYQGNSQLFNGSLYSFGVSARKQGTVFKVYKLDPKLNVTDSFTIPAGKSKAENYLQTYSDTLHDYLNIYFQEKDKKTVTILRFNRRSELIATVENADIARLNNTAMFSSEVLYFKNTVYCIKTASDTSGKQFYLNKYTLRSETLNFDYEFNWQFPFERKNIHSAHIFHADKNSVLLFVMVEGGNRAGQWILKIDAATGKLLKATKLNDKGETNSYLFGSFVYDKNYKSLHLVGQKFTEAQFSIRNNKLATGNTAASLYAIELDSLGEIGYREELRIPINDIQTIKAGQKKSPGNYILQFGPITKTPDGGLSFTGDVFKSNVPLCYLYVNTVVFNLMMTDGRLVPEKTVIAPNLPVEDYYASTDKLDMNGKLCIDSVAQFGSIFYKPLTFPVKLQFRTDGDKNPLWILGKHTTKKNGINFSFLGPVKKVYQITPIEDLHESTNPVFTRLSQNHFLISSQIEEGKYRLKLYNW